MRKITKKFSSNPMSSPEKGQQAQEGHRPTAAASQSLGLHKTVLLQSSLDILDIQPFDTVVDATLGGAGHARAIADKLGAEGCLIGFDLDEAAIARAKDALTGAMARTVVVEDNFRHIKTALEKHHIAFISKALFDLGWSQFQLGDGRGFSFLADEPLLMTYTANPEATTLTARTIVNDWAEDSISSILYGWGEERYSRRIARAIVDYRKRRAIETSLELGDLIKASVPFSYAHGRIHPATKSFQALRIAVNDELGAVEEGLKGAWEKLDRHGRIAVITFHSIEDRVVKHLFAGLVKKGEAKLVNKKPIIADKDELRANPRARSAKLRCIEKI